MLWKRDHRGRRYELRALPIGGSVRVLEQADDGWLRRVLFYLSGPATNAVIAFGLFFAVAASRGEDIAPVVGEVLPGSAAEGKLKTGDRILAVNGERIFGFTEFHQWVRSSPNQSLDILVFRDREQATVHLQPISRAERRPLGVVDRVGEVGVRPTRRAATIGIWGNGTAAEVAGLRTFDRVTEIQGRKVQSFDDVELLLARNRGETVPVTFLRPQRIAGALGGVATLAVYEPGLAALAPRSGTASVRERSGIESSELYVADVSPTGPLGRLGVEDGDRLVSLCGEELLTWHQFLVEAEACRRDLSKPCMLRWAETGGSRFAESPEDELVILDGDLAVSLRTDAAGLSAQEWAQASDETEPMQAFRNGLVGARSGAHAMPVEYEPNPNRWRLAWHTAVSETQEVTRFIVLGLWRVASGSLDVQELAGPLTLYGIIGDQGEAGATYPAWIAAVVSLNLALINLLPIPVLDGGEILIMSGERLSRRRLSKAVRFRLSIVGLCILTALMLLALRNDIVRLIRSEATWLE